MRVSYSVILLSLLAAGTLPAAVVLSQNFDDVSTLGAAGWVITNNSSAGGTSSWFQGNNVVFTSQAGAPNSYVAANFNNAGFGGDISNWLITPTVSLDPTEVLTFYTRSNGGAPDNMEVRLSTNGSSTNVGATTTSLGDFTTLLFTVNPALDASGYLTAWTQYTLNLTGMTGLTSGRFAFRYDVPDTSTNGDYIGIDTLSLTSQVPEPASGTLLLVCASAGLFWQQSRKRQRVADSNLDERSGGRS